MNRRPFGYYRARQSHCFYTKNKQIYFFSRPWSHDQGGKGISYKGRQRNGFWHIWTFRATINKPKDPGYRAKYRLELTRHVGGDFKQARVLKTKKYIRLIICI